MVIRSRLSCLALLSLSFVFSGCSEAPNAPSGIPVETVTPVFNSVGAPTIEFSVPDMMCPEGCGEKTKEILAEQPGAKEVFVNFEAKTATVAIEDEKFDAEQALAALVDHGFDHSTLKGDAVAKPQAAEAPAVQ
jgi:copper chaperone CopZ